MLGEERISRHLAGRNPHQEFFLRQVLIFISRVTIHSITIQWDQVIDRLFFFCLQFQRGQNAATECSNVRKGRVYLQHVCATIKKTAKTEQMNYTLVVSIFIFIFLPCMKSPTRTIGDPSRRLIFIKKLSSLVRNIPKRQIHRFTRTAFYLFLSFSVFSLGFCLSRVEKFYGEVK